MSLDEKKWMQYDSQFPEAREYTYESNDPTNQLPCYEYLCRWKSKIPKELYAYHFRRLLRMGTGNVPVELRLEMFEGIALDDIMYQDELDAIEGFDDFITVYRGASKSEDVPGICWSLKRYVAEEFCEGKLLVARIPKGSILAYFTHDGPEYEIIANVTPNEIIAIEQTST